MSWQWWSWLGFAAIFAAIFGAHVAWFVATGDDEIGGRLGAALTCLGIVVTALPYFRTGLGEQVKRQLPHGLLDAIKEPEQSAPHREYSSLRHLRLKKTEHKLIRPAIVHDIVAERIVGVGTILLGTAIHGYGDLVLQWFSESAYRP